MLTTQLPSFESYGNYSSDNYGAHTLVFTDGDGNDFYFSYRTLVAVRIRKYPELGLLVRENVWGPTTGKHLNWIDGGNKTARMTEEAFTEAINFYLS